ncbi:MAG: hypothetical protein WC269_04875, partial [Candidatus Gracilibacteria bacterium]
MKKGPEKSDAKPRIELPLPKVVHDAFMPIPHRIGIEERDGGYYKDFVGYHVHDYSPRKKESQTDMPRLNRENAGFYLGRFIKNPVFDGVAEVLGIEGDPKKKGIYSPEFIAGMLDYAFSRMAYGSDKKINVFVCSIFGELFNGPSEIAERTMTFEEQKALILDIAKKRFGEYQAGCVNVVNIEDVEAHKPLLGLLKGTFDEEKGVSSPDVLAVEGDVKLNENASSLEIAQYLYKAVKENQVLQEVFKNLMPEGLQERTWGDKDDDDEEFVITPRICYGLTEISIRLWEILNGRFIHGGVDRQGKYDEVIEKIVRGKNGGYKKIPELQELFKLFEGKRFDTIHVDTERNPYKFRAERTIARIRLGIFAVLGLFLAVGANEAIDYAENSQAVAIKRIINSRLQHLFEEITVRLDNSSWMQLDV